MEFVMRFRDRCTMRGGPNERREDDSGREQVLQYGLSSDVAEQQCAGGGGFRRRQDPKRCDSQYSGGGRKLYQLQSLIRDAQHLGDLERDVSKLDVRMDELGKAKPDSYAYGTYQQYRVAGNRTLRSILITVNARLSSMNTPEISRLTAFDNVDIRGIAKRKTALFVVVSDTDRSMDTLVNIFFSQIMNELCLFADRECLNQCLPIPVRFILDDYCKLRYLCVSWGQ